MTVMKLLLMATVVALPSAAVFAGPGGHGGGGGAGGGHVSAMGPGAAMGRGMSTTMRPGTSTLGGSAMGQGSTMRAGSAAQTTQSSQGSTNGGGWDHMNGPTSTGQPGVECEDVTPGRSSSAPGSAFNEDGTGHAHYAGEQPQNSRNTASISQYDVACLNQPQR